MLNESDSSDDEEKKKNKEEEEDEDDKDSWENDSDDIGLKDLMEDEKFQDYE